MTNPKKAAVGNTVNKTRRGAKADARARTEGKGKSVPVPPVMGPSGEEAGHPPYGDIAAIYLDHIGTFGRGLLAGLLGQLDALFDPGPNPWPNDDQGRWQRRQRYLKGSDWLPGPPAGLLPWSNPGEDAAEKKKVSRAMNDLEGQGLVRMEGKAAGLTAEGLVAARSVVGNIQLEACLPGLDFFLSKLGTDHEWIDEGSRGIIAQGYLSECTLAGFDPFPPGEVGKTRLPDSANWVLDALVPLAVADLIDHDFKPDFELPLYRLTERGRALAEERRDAGKADPDAWLKLADLVIEAPDAAVEDAYFAAWKRAAAELKNAQPLNRNCIAHRLSGCIWPDAVLPKADRHFKTKTA